MTKPLTTVKGGSGLYQVIQRLGGTEAFTLYLCRQDGTDTNLILKIATEVRFNSVLDREAFLLRDMREYAETLETEYAASRKDANPLNYGISFPILLETFVSGEQGGRRVEVLGFDGVIDVTKLVPIGHISSRDHVRVDPRTSAWIFGKLLKLLVFTHDQGIIAGQLTGDNILIERDQHYVVLFDWTMATRYDAGAPPADTGAEIAKAARAVLRVLGADPQTGAIPESDQLEDDRYQSHLLRLTKGKVRAAAQAHSDFYRLIRDLWPRQYHPYTTNPL